MRLPYNPKLKELSRNLRKNSTLSEALLWNQLKAKQLGGYQFNRQRPIGEYIVDFYFKKLGLVIEVDGDSHIEKHKYDSIRQKTLESQGLKVIRFHDMDIKQKIEGVLYMIKLEIETLENLKKGKITSPQPSFKGGI